MRQATHQKHGQSPGQMANTGNMMQMHTMEQHIQQQQMQQQATYDVLDTAGYCSPSNGEYQHWDEGDERTHINALS